MFNTTNIIPKVTNKIKIQACSGGIYKSHPKSRIVHMHITSELAQQMLTARREPSVNGKEIVVLQVVNAVGEYILIEYMNKDDYEAENVFFNPDGSQKQGDE